MSNVEFISGDKTILAILFLISSACKSINDKLHILPPYYQENEKQTHT